MLLKRSVIDRMQTSLAADAVHNVAIMDIPRKPQEEIGAFTLFGRFIQDHIEAGIQVALEDAEKVDGKLTPEFIEYMRATALKMALNVFIESSTEETRKASKVHIDQWMSTIEGVLSKNRGKLNEGVLTECRNTVYKQYPFLNKGGQKGGQPQKTKQGKASLTASLKATQYQQTQSRKSEAKRLLQSIDMNVKSAMKDVPEEMMGASIDFGVVLQKLQEQALAKSEMEFHKIRHPWMTSIFQKAKPFRATRGKLVAPFSPNLLRLIMLGFLCWTATGSNTTFQVESKGDLFNVTEMIRTTAHTLEDAPPAAQAAAREILHIEGMTPKDVLQIAFHGVSSMPTTSHIEYATQKGALVATSLLPSPVNKTATMRSNALAILNKPEVKKAYFEAIDALQSDSVSKGIMNKLEWTSAYNILSPLQSHEGKFGLVPSNMLNDQINKNYPWVSESQISPGNPTFAEAIQGISAVAGETFGPDADSARRYVVSDILFVVGDDLRESSFSLVDYYASSNATATQIETIYIKVDTTSTNKDTTELIESIEVSTRNIEDLVKRKNRSDRELNEAKGDLIKHYNHISLEEIWQILLNNDNKGIISDGKIGSSMVTMNRQAKKVNKEPISWSSITEEQLDLVLKDKSFTVGDTEVLKKYVGEIKTNRDLVADIATQKETRRNLRVQRDGMYDHAHTLVIKRGVATKILKPLVKKMLMQELNGNVYSVVNAALDKLSDDDLSIFTAGFYRKDFSHLPQLKRSPEFNEAVRNWNRIQRIYINKPLATIIDRVSGNFLTAAAVYKFQGAIANIPSSTSVSLRTNALVAYSEYSLQASRNLTDIGEGVHLALTGIGQAIDGVQTLNELSRSVDNLYKVSIDARRRVDDSFVAGIESRAVATGGALISAVDTAISDAAKLGEMSYKNMRTITNFLFSYNLFMIPLSILMNVFILGSETAVVLQDILLTTGVSSAAGLAGAAAGAVLGPAGAAAGATAGSMLGAGLSKLYAKESVIVVTGKVLMTPVIIASGTLMLGVNVTREGSQTGMAMLYFIGNAITFMVLRKKGDSPKDAAAANTALLSRFSGSREQPAPAGQPAAPAGAAAAGQVRRNLADAVAAGQGGGAHFTRRRPRKQRRRISRATKRSARR